MLLPRHNSRKSLVIARLVAVISLIVGLGGARAGFLFFQETPADDPKQAAKEELTTITYDLKEVVTKSRFFQFREKDLGRIEWVAQTLMAALNGKDWQAKDSPHKIRELSAKELEIHTTKENHEKVKTILAALSQMVDVQVATAAVLYEVEREFYEKNIAPGLAKRPGRFPTLLLDSKFTQKISKAGKIVSINSELLEERDEAYFFSLRQPVPYETVDKITRKKSLVLAFPGITLRAWLAVSADRRRIQMKITEQTVELVEMKKDTIVHPENGKKISFETPHLQKSSVSFEITAADQQFVLLPVHWRPPALKAERVWVLLIQPTVQIEAERRLIKEGKPPAVPPRKKRDDKVNQNPQAVPNVRR